MSFRALAAGTLDRLCTIKKVEQAVNDWGDPLQPTVTTLGQAWGKVLHVKGYEKMKSGRDIAASMVQIIMRYRDDVLPTYLVEVENLTYDIKSVVPFGRMNREGMELFCEIKEQTEAQK